ncbi:MAG TPA: hypothetical protein VD866_03400 [Urbifossiella sp.]|nr:hypothetical protein [Urbifossiella sp.]
MTEERGTLTFHHPDGDEVFALLSATMTVTRHPDEVELAFYVSGECRNEGRRQLTNAEVSVFLTEFDAATLVGRRFEVPQSYDEAREDHVSCVYYFEHNDLNRNVVEIVGVVGDGYRVQWSGEMGDDGDEALSRVVIDAVFDLLTRPVAT